jgi:thioredoxin 1
MQNFEKAKFDFVQKSGDICLLQFWSAWCGDCFDLEHLEKFQKCNKSVCVFRVNLEDNEELAEKYQIKVTPSYLFFKDFKVYETLIGVQTQSLLEKSL